MKLNSNLFYWALITGLLGFILYQKGIILVNFEKVDTKIAYTFLSDNNSTILDVRTKEELKSGMILGALHIPLDKLTQNMSQLSDYQTQKILVYCATGNRSIAAARILSNHGYTVYSLNGGIEAWKKQQLPIR